MNRRITVLSIVTIIAMVVLGQLAVAQENNIPQAVVSVEQSVLRDTPSQGGAYTGTLAQDIQVSVLGGHGSWLQVSAEDGSEGWARANHFTPLDRAKTIRTLLLFEAPNDNINYVVQLEKDTPLLILQTDETNEWVRVQTPDDVTGWTEKSLLRYDFGLSQEDEVQLYNWPDSLSAELVATLEAGQSVRIKDSVEDWIRVQTIDGIEGWAETRLFGVAENVLHGFIDLESGDQANLRTQPIIDAQSAGTIPNGDEVLILGRNAANRWLLIVTNDDRLAWTSAGLVELLDGQLDALPVLAQ